MDKYGAVDVHPLLPDETPLEASLVLHIPTNGASDAHGEFDRFATDDIRTAVVEAAGQLLVAAKPGVDLDTVYVSCFLEEYDDVALAATDEYKLTTPVPYASYESYGGNDSNEANVLARSINGLRGELAIINRDLSRLHEAGTLTPTARAEGVTAMAAINSQIAELKQQQAAATLPIYYATPFEGLRTDMGEDNPLAYAGDFDASEPTTAHLAFYDATALRQAGIRIDEKSPDQLRIYARGADIMKHCLAVMDVVYVSSHDAQ